jgi:hypothetical protein
LQGLAEKKSVSAGAFALLFPSSIERSKTFIPGFLPQPSEKSQISTTQPLLVLFLVYFFSDLSQKTCPKKN